MENDPRKTPWYPPDVNPARVGVYEVSSGAHFSHYRFWNGSVWCLGAVTIEGARCFAKIPDVRFAKSEGGEWRGLSKRPKD